MLFLIPGILLISSCEEIGNSNLKSDYALDIQIDKNHYYNEEILSEKYLDLYGQWNLTGISGGFSGGGYATDFDILSIEEIGIFKIFRNDSLVAYGKIEVLEQDDETLFISLTDETILANLGFGDMEKYVSVTDSTLTLYAPCCDRYNYHFTNCNYYADEIYFQENTQLEDILVTQVQVPEGKIFSDVFFTDTENGYLLCSDNSILKTQDGGTTWEEYDPGTEIPIHSIWFQNKDVGFAVGGASSCGGTGCTVPGSIILKTEDGGISWTEKSIPYAWSELFDVYFTDSGTGYAVGLGLKVKTTDGGETWTEFEIGYAGIVKHISFSDENTGYICGLKGNLLKTTDAGENWEILNTNTTFFLNTVCFPDNNTGFLGLNGNLMKSSDAGNTWKQLAYSPAGVYTMHFNDADNGIVFGYREYTAGDCKIWTTHMNITEDSGNSWKGDIRIDGVVNAASYFEDHKCYIVENNKNLFLVEY